MKYIPKLNTRIVFFILIMLPVSILAQVGINTTNPRTTLEVAGNTTINGAVIVENLGVVQDSDVPYLLTQNQGEVVKELNTTYVGNALAYFQEYKLTNVRNDWVSDFNTNIQASKYGMIVISAYFSHELVMDGTPGNFAIPAVSTAVDPFTGTWRIRADYPSATTDGFVNGTWTINTILITRNIAKEFPDQIIEMDGATTKEASSPIID